MLDIDGCLLLEIEPAIWADVLTGIKVEMLRCMGECPTTEPHQPGLIPGFVGAHPPVAFFERAHGRSMFGDLINIFILLLHVIVIMD